jgi:sugar lactone lactonase YvrE
MQRQGSTLSISKFIIFIISSTLIMFIIPISNDAIAQTSVSTNESYHFVKKWGFNTLSDRKFESGQSMAVNSQGNVYIIDSDNNRIQKFDSNGKFITEWRPVGCGGKDFVFPSGITVDTKGNVYIDIQDNCIQKFDSNGKFITKLIIDNSRYIDVGSSGNMYVPFNDIIQKFDSNGKFITKWGSVGSDNGQFVLMQDIAVDSSDNIYVADSGNDRIQKFDSNGNFITTWGSKGSGNGQFNYMQGIAVDSSDNVYVADTSNNRIQKFDSDGNFITKWGSAGSADGQFEGPKDIEIDSSDNVYVIDEGTNRVQVFAPVTQNSLSNISNVSNIKNTTSFAPNKLISKANTTSSLSSPNGINSKNNASVGYNQTTAIIPLNKTSALTNNSIASNAKNITISLPTLHAGISDQF